MTKTIRKDVAIIGAGASGLMCAIEAGRRGRRVIVLDHSDRIAKKVLASGGGRCNFTNLDLQPEHYLSKNPHFCKSALARFTNHDFISLVKRHSIDYCEREEGQLFCRHSAGEIVAMLHDECLGFGVEFMLGCTIGDIEGPAPFVIQTDKGEVEAASLVVASGGLSYPPLGASDLGLRIAERFGIPVIAPRPALVPLVLSRADQARFKELSGLSFGAVVRCGKKAFRGAVLFTHRGLSGPAILQISSFWGKGDEVLIDLLPGLDLLELLMAKHSSKIELATLLSEHLPRRLVRIWCDLNAPSRPLNSLSARELRAIAEKIHRWSISPVDTEGFGKAEATAGGVDTGEVSSRTMEAKKVPGLYFIGEVLDVTGILGGYNLQWAWSSGFTAGQFA